MESAPVVVERDYQTVISNDVWSIFDRTTGNPVCFAVRLCSDDADYTRLSAKFSKTGAMQVNAVWRVHHSVLEEAYNLCRSTAGNPTEQIGYHTSKAPLDVLLATGLDVNKARAGLFGKGIYAAQTVPKSSSYWQWQFDARIMLEVSMLTGSTYLCPLGQTRQGLQAPPPGFDSVTGNVHGQPEFVVYENSRVLIKFIIDYTVLPAYPAFLRSFLLPPQAQTKISQTKSTQTKPTPAQTKRAFKAKKQ